ncbi:MAG TPA: helical backbone metal receptor [Vicinamibacterales bacterium]|nr:helical backbone metal receptor [Vicinamibacterales bacterium]
MAPLPTGATRIVSLVPNVTEMLFAVGAGPQLVGVSSYDDFPPETKALPRVGALLDPDTERILSLRPDLVIVYGSQSELEGQFTRAGIRVYPYRHGGIDSILQAIRDVARLSGHPADGDRVIRELRSQLDAVVTRVRGQRRPRTMLVIGRDAGTLRGVYVSGGIGFLHELLDIAGGDDVFGDIKREAVQPSNETMIVRAPEVIMELHPGEQPPADVLRKERAAWNLLASVPAVRTGRVHLLYGGYLLAAGPRIGRAAEAFARVLHPDSFK